MALFKDRASVSNELLFKLKHWPWVIISEQVAQLSLFTSPSCVVVLVLFHLENKPSQRSAEMLAQFQSSHCLVLGVHLLTCSTNTLQILIKGSSAHVHSCQKFCHTYWSDASVHSVWLMVYFERSGLGWWIDFLITICIDLVLHTEKCDLTSSLSSLRCKSQAIY